MTEPSGFLGLEQRIEPRDAGPLAAALAEHAAPARVEVVYPGVWLRDDVYAIHGHYSDLHATVPTFERLAAGAMARWAVELPGEGATPDDYEAVLSPLYAWMHALTQRADHALVSAGAGASSRAWVALGGSGRRPAPGHRRAARRLRGRGGRHQRARRSGRSSATCPAPACAAATCTASSRCSAPRRARAARDLRPLAPLRPVAGRRPRRVDHPRRRPRAQHRLVGLPAALPRAARRTARPTGRARPSSSRTRSRRGWCACWNRWGEAGRVARHARPDAEVEHACVWCGWMTSS